MQNFFNNMFNALNQQDNHIIIMVVYLVFVIVSITLRIIAHVHFRGTLFTFQMDARKEIKEKSDISNIKNKLLRKTVAEYIRTADRAASAAPTAQIVQRTVATMSLFGWKYEAILPFVEAMDIGFIWVGLVLALAFNEYAFMYSALTVLAFVITRIFTAFFNAKVAKSQLIDEMHMFVEREISRFYASDSSGAILRLKNDLTEVIDKQSATYKETMENIGHVMATVMTKVSDSMAEATKTIGPAVAAAMDEKVINMNDTLKSNLASWESALSEATRLQTSMNDSSERISHSTAKLQSASELLATHMQGHSNSLSAQILTLVDAINTMKDSVNHFVIQQEALTQQAKYIERNQQTLESSLHSYETSLQGLTQSLGDGLGAFINLHTQTAAQEINDTLSSNVEKIMNASRAASKLDNPRYLGLEKPATASAPVENPEVNHS